MKNQLLLLFCCAVHLLSAQAPELTAALKAKFESSDIPGCAMAIVSPEGVLYKNSFGFANRDDQLSFQTHHLQNIGSISKTFVGVALMKAVELGQLQLDDDINQHLPFKIQHPRHPKQPITIQHLATHTSGIRDRASIYELKSYVVESPPDNTQSFSMLMKYMLRKNSKNTALSMEEYFRHVLVKDGAWYKRKNFYRWAPGTHYAYSNIGAALAAFIIEQATGEDFRSFTQRHILDPISMDHSGWNLASIDSSLFVSRYSVRGGRYPQYSLITYPDGGFISSVDDMSRYLMWMMQGYFGESPLLSAASFQKMMANQISVPDGERQGIFWDVYSDSGQGDIGHSGSDPGVTTFMYFDPEKRVGSILFFNVDLEKGLQKPAIDLWLLLVRHQEKFTTHP
ncbi:MAG: serine hydrolase domain-containing protein [Bacteroidota bacterium]